MGGCCSGGACCASEFFLILTHENPVFMQSLTSEGLSMFAQLKNIYRVKYFKNMVDVLL